MNDPTALARQHFMDGVVHFEASRLGDAERCFEAALALVPGRPSVLTNLGATRVRLAKFAEAAPLLRQACAAEPGNADAWGHLGTACAELGLLEEALGAFDRALQIDPDFEREAEIRAHKKLLAELEQAHKKATAGRKRLLREVTLDQALTQPDPEAVYLGLGYAASARRDVQQIVLLIGKDDRAG